MAVTINGIACEELVDGYVENYDITGGPAARKGYLCPWADRFTVVHGILGLSSTTHVGGLITLHTPLPYPELAAESTNLLASQYARSCEVYGSGPPIQGTNNISFFRAKIYVTYGPFPWSFAGLDYFQLDPLHPYIWAEQHTEISAEYITVPGQAVKFNTSGNVLGDPFGFLSPLMDFTITLKNMPYLPVAAALNAMQAPVSSTNYLQCNAGFLMFKGMSDDRQWASDGTMTASATFAFSYRPLAPWDYSFDPSTGLWDKVVSVVGGHPVLARSDLSNIIPSAYII